MIKLSKSLIHGLNSKLTKIIFVIIIILILSYLAFMVSDSFMMQAIVMVLTVGFIFGGFFKYLSTREKYLTKKLRQMQLQQEEITDKIKNIKKELKHKEKNKLEMYYNKKSNKIRTEISAIQDFLSRKKK
tara:strand:+ start:1413 stop:1802 length:390 start_codon:yes stop_codon:yes gene_type:complete